MGDYFTNSDYSQSQPKKASYVPGAADIQAAMGQAMVPQMSGQMAPQYSYNTDMFNIDVKELVKRASKYLIEGLVLAFFAYYFTKGKLDTREIIMLALTGALTFSVLDYVSPTVAVASRFGTGFGLGGALYGVAPGMMAAPMMMI